MKLLQAEEIESQRQLKKIEVTYPEVLTDIKEYKGQSDLLTANLIVIDNAIAAQANIADENAASVDLLLDAAVEALLKLNVRATTTATAAGDKVLVKLLAKSDTYYRINTKEICIQKLDAGVKLLEDRHLVLSNIIPADIISIKGTIDTYRDNKDMPRTEIVTKKTDGTDVLKVAVNVGKKIKKLMIKLLMGEYRVSNPTLAEKAKNLGTPVELGRHHNVGFYSVINATTGEAIDTAVITEVKTSVEKKKVKTRVYAVDGNGMKVFVKHILGKVTLTVAATGFVQAIMDVKFKKNDPNEFVIGMTRVLPK